MTPHHMLNAIFILFACTWNPFVQSVILLFYYFKCFVDGVNASFWHIVNAFEVLFWVTWFGQMMIKNSFWNRTGPDFELYGIQTSQFVPVNGRKADWTNWNFAFDWQKRMFRKQTIMLSIQILQHNNVATQKQCSISRRIESSIKNIIG